MKTLLTLLLLAFAAGVPGPASAANVAVILSDRVDDYQEALRGFKETVRHPIVAEYNMNGDLERGRKILTEIETKVKPDLIFAIGLWALQAIVSQPTDIPVVYAMVLNPPSIVGTGTRNITGASMNVPVEQPLRLLKQLGPQIKRVGVIFNRARTGYLVKRAEAVAREEGLQLIAKEISSPKEAITAGGGLQRDDPGPQGQHRRERTRPRPAPRPEPDLGGSNPAADGRAAGTQHGSPAVAGRGPRHG